MNQTLYANKYPGGQKLEIVQGDITQEKVDAIVNAANAQLMHGGGIAGIIARKGGPGISVESKKWIQNHGPVHHGSPAYTTGGNLPCKYVIHAVGPVWGSGDEDEKLAATVIGSLRCASKLELSSIALPAISTGIFRFPKARAAGIIYKAIQIFFAENPETTVNLVRIILFDQPTLDAFVQVFKRDIIQNNDPGEAVD
jgi:O-acetyl-ADP-ribose deacetylase (regulator of RNase III)